MGCRAKSGFQVTENSTLEINFINLLIPRINDPVVYILVASPVQRVVLIGSSSTNPSCWGINTWTGLESI